MDILSKTGLYSICLMLIVLIALAAITKNYYQPLYQQLAEGQTVANELFIQPAHNVNPNLKITFKIRHPIRYAWWKNDKDSNLCLKQGNDLEFRISWSNRIPTATGSSPQRFALMTTDSKYVVHTNSRLKLHPELWDRRYEWSWLFLPDKTFANETVYRIYTDSNPDYTGPAFDNIPNTGESVSEMDQQYKQLARQKFHVGYDNTTDSLGVYPWNDPKVVSWIVEVSSIERKPEFMLVKKSTSVQDQCVVPHRDSRGLPIPKDDILQPGTVMGVGSCTSRMDNTYTRTEKGSIQHVSSGFCLTPESSSDKARLQLLDNCEENNSLFVMKDGVLKSNNSCMIHDPVSGGLVMNNNCTLASEGLVEKPFSEVKRYLDDDDTLNEVPDDLISGLAYGSNEDKSKKQRNVVLFNMRNMNLKLKTFVAHEKAEYTSWGSIKLDNDKSNYKLNHNIFSGNTALQYKDSFTINFIYKLSNSPAGMFYFFIGSRFLPTMSYMDYNSQRGLMIIVSYNPNFVGGASEDGKAYQGVGIFIIDNNNKCVQACPIPTSGKDSNHVLNITFSKELSKKWTIKHSSTSNNRKQDTVLQFTHATYMDWVQQSANLYGFGYYRDLYKRDVYLQDVVCTFLENPNKSP